LDGRDPIQGEDVLEFRLLYQGILRANGSVEDKFSIRRQLHPQLRRLWRENPLLRDACERIGLPHDPSNPFEYGIDTLAGRIGDFRFLPLSQKKFFLRCSIDVLFLRREKPGKVFMRGDIDNRLKTLFDALKMPSPFQECGEQKPKEDENPFYVLLEDDETIADVSVTTDRLLQFPPEHEYSKDYAVLVINVKLEPIRNSAWGYVFSGR
jgi:hypothetical protein